MNNKLTQKRIFLKTCGWQMAAKKDDYGKNYESDFK